VAFPKEHYTGQTDDLLRPWSSTTPERRYTLQNLRRGRFAPPLLSAPKNAPWHLNVTSRPVPVGPFSIAISEVPLIFAASVTAVLSRQPDGLSCTLKLAPNRPPLLDILDPFEINAPKRTQDRG
jgi:hypothetical protein